MHYKLPLVFEPQPEGGYTVTSPAVPELLTEGDSVENALDNVRDALAAVLEIYRDLGKSLPSELAVDEVGKELHFDLVVAVP
jgi:antitoxin HicB